MKSLPKGTIILGAGATGLAVAHASGCPVFEASPTPGGICSSYYVSPNGSAHSAFRDPGDNDYRFELGGGHWIFGGNDETLGFMESLSPMKSYVRKSSVWFPKSQSQIPFPIQYHLSHFSDSIKEQAFRELLEAQNRVAGSLKDHLIGRFGPTLSSVFFEPFHRAYTAGLHERIAPQDDFKSPLNVELVRKGFDGAQVSAGYNVTFRYPVEGLGTFFQRMASHCDVRYSHRVVAIDPKSHTVHFANGEIVGYGTLVSTLPLSTMAKLTGLGAADTPDPHTSVLVVNIGGVRGELCPDDHWVYVPDASSGFYRIGFYSNVDESFLPQSLRGKNQVSIYAECAFAGGVVPSRKEIDEKCSAVVSDLISWKYLEKAEVVHPTWIDVAYTWSFPGSQWKNNMLSLLGSHSIHQAGRYARWNFQGIAESIREGLELGKQIREQMV